MEMIVVISLLGVVGVIVSGFLIATMKANSKAEITKEVRQNGDYALSVMQGMILNSLSVGCTPPYVISVRDIENQLTVFRCNTTTGIISSNSANLSANLTGPNVGVSNCNFSCSLSPGKPTRVTIDFIIGNKGTGLRPEEKSSVNFKSEVMTRNY